jgi:hypothetical protein
MQVSQGHSRLSWLCGWEDWSASSKPVTFQENPELGDVRRAGNCLGFVGSETRKLRLCNLPKVSPLVKRRSWIQIHFHRAELPGAGGARHPHRES